MKKTTAMLCLLVGAGGCGGGLSSLPSGPKPGWVGEAQNAEYPESKYLTGVGMTAVKSDDVQQVQAAADAAARTELTKKIEVSVSSAFSSYEAEKTVNGVSTSEQSVAARSEEAVKDMELEGVEIKQRWRDASAGVVYALAVWPKARAEALLKAKMTEAEQVAKKSEAEGDAQVAGNPAGALRHYMAARAGLEKTQSSAMLLRAVTGVAATVPDVAPVRGKLAKLLDEVDVQIAGGDAQRVKPSMGAAQPLTVKATLRGAPVAGLPVTFTMVGGTVDGRAVTDAQGIAEARVSNAGPMGDGEGKVTAKVDWTGMAGIQPPPAWAQTLRPTELSFRVVPATLGATRVLVKIIERIDDAPTAIPAGMQSAISTAFSSAGFGVQDGAALLTRVQPAELLTLDPKMFQKAARDIADIVVVGEAVSSYSSTLSGEVVVHRARMNVRAVDLGTGQVIGTWTLEQKGQPGKGPEKAGRKALDALAKALGPDYFKSVKQKLGY